MPAPRVCILTETYYPVVGGGETQARMLAERLVELGLPVVVITRRSDASLASHERFGAITVYRLPPVGPRHLKKWGLLLTCVPALVRLRKQFDVVFVSGYRVVGPAAVVMARLLRKACVLKADSAGEMSGAYYAHGLASLKLERFSRLFRVTLAVRNFVLRRADAFVAISSEILAEHIGHGVDGRRIVHIPNSVDTRKFAPVDRAGQEEIRQRLGLLPKVLLAIYTGRLVSYKGLPLLLQVWRDIQAHHPEAGLLLVGEGGLDVHNCESELRRYVSEQGLADSVQFAGSVRNVHEYLQASDIFVLPSETEGFSVSLIEAMACGLAIVATPVGGAKDVLVHGQNGLLVAPGDPGQLPAALATLLEDSSLCSQLGSAARQMVQDQYSTDSVSQMYVGLFERVIGERSRSSVKEVGGPRITA